MLLKTLLFLSDPLHPHTQPPRAFSSSLNLPPTPPKKISSAPASFALFLLPSSPFLSLFPRQPHLYCANLKVHSICLSYTPTCPSLLSKPVSIPHPHPHFIPEARTGLTSPSPPSPSPHHQGTTWQGKELCTQNLSSSPARGAERLRTVGRW